MLRCVRTETFTCTNNWSSIPSYANSQTLNNSDSSKIRLLIIRGRIFQIYIIFFSINKNTTQDLIFFKKKKTYRIITLKSASVSWPFFFFSFFSLLIFQLLAEIVGGVGCLWAN